MYVLRVCKVGVECGALGVGVSCVWSLLLFWGGVSNTPGCKGVMSGVVCGTHECCCVWHTNECCCVWHTCAMQAFNVGPSLLALRSPSSAIHRHGIRTEPASQGAQVCVYMCGMRMCTCVHVCSCMCVFVSCYWPREHICVHFCVCVWCVCVLCMCACVCFGILIFLALICRWYSSQFTVFVSFLTWPPVLMYIYV